MKNWGVRQPVGKWQTSRTDQKHMGNLQSERISSEENRNSFFPTATTMGKDFRIHWASERQVLSSSSSSSAQKQLLQAEREEEQVLDCQEALCFCLGSGPAPSRGRNRAEPREGKFAPKTENQWRRFTGFDVWGFWLVVWSSKPCWKTSDDVR